MRRYAATLLAAAVLLLSGCGTRDEAERHELGRKVYNFRCYFCHGYSGDAKTLAATYLSPPPRDFTQGPPLDAASILKTLREGRAGTAMKSFVGIVDDEEMQAVAAFVEQEFVRRKARNTAYHTAENGWPDHQRFAAAFPFVTGALKLDAPAESLDDAQRAARRLFLEACVSCHDRAHVEDEGPAWSSRPLSYPRMGFVPGDYGAPPPDAVSSASVYAKHDVVPRIEGLTPLQKRGEALFQANCAFCHGADGTGKNWIGQFMEPKARDLTMYSPQTLPAARLRQTIREGLPGTSMPAWRDVFTADEVDAVAAYVMRAFFRRDGG
ncbi:cytochrome c [uncultured Piscinibacter sp.]|uniref:c-type cytochrome n=1 Tax=uncultured Piscinibacter sp. TaxID=1131835 RepID=UPI00261849C8|nr:cytochrome c [uncultured Piscinibacter sp.]